jgi:hypothetical protein
MDEVNSLVIQADLHDAVGEKRAFTNIKSLFQFIEKEDQFWEKEQEKYSNINIKPLNLIRSSFNQALVYINNFKDHYSQWQGNKQLEELKNITNVVQSKLDKAIFSETPFGDLFLKVCQRGRFQAESFWEFVLDRSNQDVIQRTERLEGSLLGYEYLHKDESVITNRRDSEKRSLDSMRKSLSDKTDEVIGETSSLLAKLNGDVATFIKETDEWKKAAIEELSQQRDDDRVKNDQYYAQANQSLQELETRFKDKLRLEKPAEYWNKQASKFRIVGYWWGGELILTTLLCGGIFVFLFIKWLQSGRIIERFSVDHWQGIIILATILSLMAFLIRAFAKLTFSSFHLQRDAEEREQLAYFYLSLTNDTQIDPESRKIVFQSLFSRSDTGLLSGDHGPTIPGEVITKKINN